jgi:hypothetical protein
MHTSSRVENEYDRLLSRSIECHREVSCDSENKSSRENDSCATLHTTDDSSLGSRRQRTTPTAFNMAVSKILRSVRSRCSVESQHGRGIPAITMGGVNTNDHSGDKVKSKKLREIRGMKPTKKNQMFSDLRDFRRTIFSTWLGSHNHTFPVCNFPTASLWSSSLPIF